MSWRNYHHLPTQMNWATSVPQWYIGDMDSLIIYVTGNVFTQNSMLDHYQSGWFTSQLSGDRSYCSWYRQQLEIEFVKINTRNDSHARAISPFLTAEGFLFETIGNFGDDNIWEIILGCSNWWQWCQTPNKVCWIDAFIDTTRETCDSYASFTKMGKKS